MSTTKHHAVAADPSVACSRWRAAFDGLLGRIASRFGRVEPRRHARKLLLGLLSDLPRKNCWTIAEHVGDPSPDALQHLLARAVWDQDTVRDDVRAYVVEHLGAGADDDTVVLVIDETGDLKHGTATVGVARQYTGTAGKIDNAQVGVYLAYATGAGHALIDRELYLPKRWTADRDRCHAAGVPDQVAFATKPALATRMITRTLDAGVAAGWVTGDEVYGADPKLRATLEARAVGYVLAVACDHRVRAGGDAHRVDALATRVPKQAWQVVSAGRGAKGHRLYAWAAVQLDPALDPDHGAAVEGQGGPAGQRWLLLRRNRSTGELAFYRCWTPRPVPLGTLIRVAGTRWRVEQAFQAGKGLCGLDEHQVRRWRSWYRWATLAMAALAFLAVLAVNERARQPTPADLIPLTCNELQHLFVALLVAPPSDPGHRLRWSWWRRRHQARARTCHYQRQATQDP